MSTSGKNFANQFQTPLGYQQFTSLASAITLGTTAPSTGPTAIPATATLAVIYAEGAGIRWRDDGTAPTSAIGMPVASGQAFAYYGTFGALKIIQQSASATLNVSYYA